MNFKNKSVCVTGAGGSIGSELCIELIKREARELRLVCLTEGALYNLLKMINALPSRTRAPPVLITPVLGSVLDDRLMFEAVKGCDVVIHAAAHKHVPICEFSPIAAIENNVRGTYIAAQAAESAGVEVFVLISTDKAVFPASIMGATKRCAELLVRDVMAPGRTKFVICRFGNVLDSAGSVLPLWREQIAKGGPLTLTSADCTRYFMSIPEAVELILTTAGFEAGGPYIFDMGKPRNMGQMARQLMVDMNKHVKIRETGLRPGEKLTEALTYGGPLTPTRHPKIHRVAADFTRPLQAKQLLDLLAASRERNLEGALKYLWSIVK
jgi:FlaA1/EpsC-like NDP-sugar epimerase